MSFEYLSGDVTATVTVGRYFFEVGAPAGVRLTAAPSAAKAATGPLADALARQPPESSRRPAAEVSERVEDASHVTDVAEKAVHVFGALAEGKFVDPDLLEAEVDAVFGLVKRLDRERRHDDAIRLARAASALLILTLRWGELIDSLDVALRAAKEELDSPALGWVYHELGSLKLGADDAEGAVDFLRQARDIREHSPGEHVLCLTEHNLVLALERLRAVEQYGLIRRRTLMLGGATLLIGGGVGVAEALSNQKTSFIPPATTPPHTTPPHTTPPHTTPPHTTPPHTTPPHTTPPRTTPPHTTPPQTTPPQTTPPQTTPPQTTPPPTTPPPTTPPPRIP